MIIQGITDSFKQDILMGLHAPEHLYRIALYTDLANLNRQTKAYSYLTEVVAKGYDQGGQELRGILVHSEGGVALMDWAVSPVWNNADITARGALIYNASLPGKNSVIVIDLGKNCASTNGPFKVGLPKPGKLTSLVRIN